MARQNPTLAVQRSLFRAGERVCVAVSGGADSVALLLALIEANTAGPQNKEPLGIVLRVAHVHHGLRGAEADADAAFVATLCERLGVPCDVMHVDTAARQAEAGEGLEEAARHLRYQALTGVVERGLAETIATAHTLDDQAETLVMKFLRGAWTEGLSGIAQETGVRAQGSGPRVVRPLLGVRRAAVEAHLRARHQDWREDSSNRDTTLTRNRIRHELLPVLRGYNPALDELLARTAEIAADEEAYWQAEVARLLPPMLLPGKPVRGGGRAVSTAVESQEIAVELERVRTHPKALQRRLLRAMAARIGARLTAEETAKVMALAGFAEHPTVRPRIGARLELRDGLRVERSVRELRMLR